MACSSSPSASATCARRLLFTWLRHAILRFQSEPGADVRLSALAGYGLTLLAYPIAVGGAARRVQGAARQGGGRGRCSPAAIALFELGQEILRARQQRAGYVLGTVDAQCACRSSSASAPCCFGGGGLALVVAMAAGYVARSSARRRASGRLPRSPPEPRDAAPARPLRHSDHFLGRVRRVDTRTRSLRALCACSAPMRSASTVRRQSSSANAPSCRPSAPASPSRHSPSSALERDGTARHSAISPTASNSCLPSCCRPSSGWPSPPRKWPAPSSARSIAQAAVDAHSDLRLRHLRPYAVAAIRAAEFRPCQKAASLHLAHRR